MKLAYESTTLGKISARSCSDKGVSAWHELCQHFISTLVAARNHSPTDGAACGDCASGTVGGLPTSCRWDWLPGVGAAPSAGGLRLDLKGDQLYCCLIKRCGCLRRLAGKVVRLHPLSAGDTSG